MVISPKIIKQAIGFGFLMYGFLVLSEPSKYATWFNYPNYFGLLGFGLILFGIILLYRG